ncbi:MAG TPA: hypothetical protein VN578_20460 [Candidatus Binatia bacterium]|jgi:hypothetical protein|nr:hypothetical protein [Candidatus Binatia bacterium]
MGHHHRFFWSKLAVVQSLFASAKALLVFGLSFGLGLGARGVPGDGHWDRQFNMPGTASRNFSLRFNGNLLYTGGYNLNAGLVDTNAFISVFDGTNWSILGQVNGGTTVVEDYAFLNGNVYVGGVFLGVAGVPAVGLAKWDGANWSGVGGFKGAVLCLTTDGTNLYVGGSFTNVGGVFNTNFAKWNGTNWSSIGGGIGYYNALNSVVGAIALRNGQIYIGGSFTNAGTTAATNLAVWNGASWSQIGGGVGGAVGDAVSSFQFLGTDLYAGGKFASAGGVAALNIAKWNGTTWSALGAGLKGPSGSTPVDALAFLGSDLYASGNFTNAGGIAAAQVAKWDGNAWYNLGGINGSGIRAVSNSGSIYFAGTFNLASNTIGDHIVRFDGTNWYGITGKPAQGTHFFVQALGLGSDGLYMGGFFAAAGTTVASRIARWDGTNWNALGDGVSGSFAGFTPAVRAIKARSDGVYVGGDFAIAGGQTVDDVAVWDGANWSPLGYGVDASVFAIDASDTEVYVGGAFTNAYYAPGGYYTVNHIASWDAVNGWLPLNSGVNGNGTVSAICVAGNGLVYAAGSFTNMDGVTANRIAAWDGSFWYSLGTGTGNGLNNSVSALLFDGSVLYVGGTFTTAGGATARGIAQWDGATWSTLGQGMFANGTASVRALAKIGGYLYAGGTITNAGGSVITRAIARWDGAQWQALGSGAGNDESSPRVSALAAWGNDLFVGGIFETAGLSDSGYIARWNDQIDFTPPPVMQLSKPQMLTGNAFKFHASATFGATYVIDYSSDLSNWTPLATNSIFSLDVTNAAPGINFRVYRMREIP